MKRTVFCVSDSTGITAETLGNSLLSQFEQIQFDRITIPYVNSIEKAKNVVEKINLSSKESKALVFSSLVNQEIRKIISQANCLFIDIFDTFMNSVEEELKSKPSQDIGKSHGVVNLKTYEKRIDAVNFALDADDGKSTKHFEMADVILIGVSRCGKTPTCLYMALQFGVFAANYPITEEDMVMTELPKNLIPYQKKLFGLTIAKDRLHEIRNIRSPNSRYASFKQCEYELETVEKMFNKAQVPFLNSTSFSIEEIASKIVEMMGIKRKLF